MAKLRSSAYLPSKRTDAWLKIKARQSIECLIVGYTKGKGDRAASFGAVHLALRDEDKLKYVGKAGSGFDDSSMKETAAELESLAKIKRPVPEKPLDDAQSVWVEPRLVCEVRFASWTKDGLLREPVFVRMRPDLTGIAPSDNLQP